MTAAPGTIVVRGSGQQPRFALSFDDGPGPCTSELIAVLGRSGLKATFFLVGSQVERHPELAARLRDAGHELGLHSMAHRDHAQIPPAEAVEDVVAGADAIGRLIGVDVELFRAPYGHFVPATLAEAERRGWSCVMWSAWGEDWRDDRTAEKIAAQIVADLRPGAIVPLHDSRREQQVECARMLRALELVLDEAGRRGLSPVTVGELLESPAGPS